MLKDNKLHNDIEDAVGEAERRTSAEIVVCLASSSGSYRDVDLTSGAILAVAVLVGIIFLPVDVHPVLAVTYTIAFFFLGAALSALRPGLRRLLCTQVRRLAQVRSGATLAFHEESVTATRERNGILIYVSLFENAAQIVPDLGVAGRVPGAVWNELQRQLESSPKGAQKVALLATIGACGDALARPFPPGEDNPDEIPNRPRIRA